MAQSERSPSVSRSSDPRRDIIRGCFIGRTDAFAAENRNGSGWTAVRREIPDDLVDSHLRGTITVASYPLSPEGRTRWLCFDVDDKTDAARDLLRWLHHWFNDNGMKLLLEDTGGRGLHGWVLFNDWLPADKAIALARLVLAEYGKVKGDLPCPVEVFPKQAKPSDLGNAVRLPWGKHRSGHWSHFLNSDFKPDDAAAIQYINKDSSVTEQLIDNLLPVGTDEVQIEAKPRLMSSKERWAVEIAEGKRHTALLSLAGELRAKGFTGERLSTELKLHNAQRCSPPLPDGEIEAIAKAMAAKGNGRQPEAPKKQLSAKFDGLIDVVDSDGTVKYLMLNSEGQPVIADEIICLPLPLVPPGKEHLPFPLPKASAVVEHIIGDDDRRLFADLVAYVQRVAQLPSEIHYKLIAWWVLHTYLYDRFSYSPMIAMVGLPERGKTRLGRTVITLSYRGLETETLRESNLFRWSQDLGASIFLDVKDIWRKAEKERSEDILLKRFEKGGKVGRVLYPEKGPFRDTVYFDIYGPTIIATNESIHHILDTRCLPIAMPDAGQTVWPELDREAALAFKERLVAFRARHMAGELPSYPKPPLGRLGDILQPLGVIMRVVSPEEEQAFQEMTTNFWLERLEEKSQSKEARLIAAVDQIADDRDTVPVSEVAQAYNEGLEPKQQLSPESIGRRLRALGFQGNRVAGRVRTRVITIDRQFLVSQKVRWGLELPEDSGHPQKKPSLLSLPSYQLHNQARCTQDGSKYELSLDPSNTENISVTMHEDSKDSKDGFAEGGDVVMVDYYLPDGTPVVSDDIMQRWVNHGKPPIKVWSQTVTDLKAYLDGDVDLDELAVIMDFLTRSATAAAVISKARDNRPTRPCWVCGCDEWWQRWDGGWVCDWCHPKPPSVGAGNG